MKTIHTITAALLILSSFSAIANDGPAKEIKKNKEVSKFVRIPEFVWGTPEILSADDLKPAALNFPAFVWGDPESSFESAKTAGPSLSFPEFVWGDATDINEKSAPDTIATISFPEFVWGILKRSINRTPAGRVRKQKILCTDLILQRLPGSGGLSHSK